MNDLMSHYELLMILICFIALRLLRFFLKHRVTLRNFIDKLTKKKPEDE